MTHNETIAFNAGISAFATIAAASAEARRAKLTEAPTRYSFAIEALVGIVEAAQELSLPMPGNPASSALPANSE